ncbi:D-serine deaminase-like pyridoxal phosphate-dependent protein [Cellulosimicrobium cellulans]|uniref:Alanine racemase n=1 Tax=Cellulosimicrobium cellulans TaxID=1710 RepID=A0A1Y0HQZ6_CELCE|nr:alanine racemase [Cellulosimicrobium cellulans]ARU50568.1 alanine racemase [Cellulosimicrobium cellulans]MBM7820924.1 D-serine deaminase-like pyridoxal phosphate-dependent protein [Cellulosimicrobium cellulans]
MTGTTHHTLGPAPDRPWAGDGVGPRTKGLRLDAPATVADVLAGSPRVTDAAFSWPLLTLDDATLDHNVSVVARVCAERGVEHAPHVKTTMSRALYARQAAAGAWGATVATPSQLRTVRDWGVPRVLLANELLDPREIAWLRDDLTGVVDGSPDEVWLCVDSPHGVDLLARGLADAPAAVRARVGVLVELGVPGGRTGVRSTAAALDLARAVRASGLRLLGVTGYEGSVAGGTSGDELAAVGAWCDGLRDLGSAFVREGLAGVDEPLVLSAGGSSFLDVVLAELPGPVPGDDRGEVEVRVVVRSGAYVTHDHGFYSRTDPWSRIPGAEPLRGAATVWGQVLSVPEPGLAICGVGRRDVSFDIDLPVALWLRSQSDDGWLPARELAGTRVTALNDQHLYLALDAGAGQVTGPATAQVRPGDVVGFGISHPCTTFDRWRVAAVVRGDEVVDLATIDL